MQLVFIGRKLDKASSSRLTRAFSSLCTLSSLSSLCAPAEVEAAASDGHDAPPCLPCPPCVTPPPQAELGPLAEELARVKDRLRADRRFELIEPRAALAAEAQGEPDAKRPRAAGGGAEAAVQLVHMQLVGAELYGLSREQLEREHARLVDALQFARRDPHLRKSHVVYRFTAKAD